MGYVKVRIRNVHIPKNEVELELLADTGAFCTIVHRRLLETMQIKPTSKRRFKTADGRIIERRVSIAEIEIGNEKTRLRTPS